MGLIERQKAIDAIADMHCKSDEDGYVWIIRSDAWARIDALPSAQPGIVRCKDCLKYDAHGHRCKHWNHAVVVMDWCSRAERKEE